MDWHSAGMLDREVAYYKYLYKLGVSTTFISYGNKLDLDLAEKIYPIKICCNKWGLPRRIFELFIHLRNFCIVNKIYNFFLVLVAAFKKILQTFYKITSN